MSTEAYNTLIDRLLHNKLIPGMFLNRQELASELGFSVAPIREAMKQLEREGFLVSIPRKGTQVRPIRLGDVRGQLLVREALECQAARLYCGEAVAANEPHLRGLAEVLDTTSLDTSEHWRADLKFHEALLDLTSVDALIQEYKRVLQLNIFYSLNRFVSSADRRDVSGHKQLIEDLKTPNGDKAEKVIRAHVRSGKRRLLGQLR